MTTIVSIKTNKQKKRYDFACPGLTQVRYRSFYYEEKKKNPDNTNKTVLVYSYLFTFTTQEHRKWVKGES